MFLAVANAALVRSDPWQNKLTHLDDAAGRRWSMSAHKPVTAREAVAEGFISLQPATLQAIADEKVPKGEVLNTARIAGILAAKRCGDLIPLCHPLPIESVEVDFDVPELEPDGGEPVAPAHQGRRPHHRQDRRRDGSPDRRRRWPP